MAEKSQKSGGAGMTGMLLVHAVCCGGILLFATGAFGAWFFEDGLIWLAVGGTAAAAAFLLRRWRAGSRESVTRAPERRPS